MSVDQLPGSADVVVIGAGHNGLVAAVLLARAGLDVLVCETAAVVGGAARTERPFAGAPRLGHSTGAYLLGLMPPELLHLLDIDLPVLRRDPHYFLPTPGVPPAGGGPGVRFLLFGQDRGAARAQLERCCPAADLAADDAMHTELAKLRADLAPAWLGEPLPVEQTAERYLRPSLRQVFVDLVRGSVTDYLARFDFASELLMAMYTVTDGLSGVSAGPDDPGTGHNFLVHNMCRLPGSDGTWMIVKGGMGTVTGVLADAARRAGARIHTGATVTSILLERGYAAGVVLDGGHAVAAPVVLGACDPYRLMELVPGGALPAALTDRMAAVRRQGTTLKVNLALSGVPRFACLPDGAPDPSGATVHLLPGSESLLGTGGGSPMAALRGMWDDVRAGRLPAEPTVEWYLHTTVDPSLADPEGRHSSALFVQSVPHTPAGSSWEAELPSYLERLLAVCDRYAPGTSDLVVDAVALTPPGIEAHFGITGGHIHHVDNTVSFTDRMPYATGVDGVYAGGAGCHPAGSVIGAAGHNAAVRVLTDLGLVRAGRRPGGAARSGLPRPPDAPLTRTDPGSHV